ncbi:unnamed protein product [Rotaria magnacalcarata]|uniref:EGF-like domain-containing protein n=1 Tax=Rotaria magnacalcarata TaxID=392030 RepID=A0A816GWW4_9BILA|nr:unnamed protein product [Rotaria magnacalcarata]CAF4062796.1 unnamed protein product [Rotaria magnacalcarata]
MALFLPATNDIPLLFQSTEPLVITRRSRSKRLQSFIHYEHSSHPRRFIILFFTIIFVSLAIGWLIAGLVRLRQTATYLESCADQKVQCATGTSLVCSLSSSICLCPEQNYWDTKTQMCLGVRSINMICSINEQCDTSKGLICQTIGLCQCPQNTYYTSSGCITYLLWGAACVGSGAAPCNPQFDLTCDNVTQICLCPSSTYWSYAGCESLSTYAGYCDKNKSCNTQIGLFCRLPDSNTPCDCPLQSKFYTCDCQQGQTWITATSSSGTSTCMNQGTYYSNCTNDSQCPQAVNLVCIGGICNCNLPLWYWSPTSSKCLPCESQGHILIQYSSQWVCTRLISSSLITYTASKVACTGVGWSLISPIFASDISAIAQIYPTYRLWIDMETSLGSSNYTNNIFPNNQSNWNNYISRSLAAVYSTYTYALQIVPSYDKAMVFEGNTNLDVGQALCAFY